MSLFAGIVSLRPTPEAIPDSLSRSLRAGLTRWPGDEIQVAEGPGYVLCAVDLGVYGGGVLHRRGDASLMLCAGDPLLGRNATSDDRPHALERLHADLATSTPLLLAQSRGTFCAVRLDVPSRRLLLVTDKLGLRPVYHAVADGYVTFATSMRALAGCPHVPRTGDLRGLAETACYGYPLGDRTVLAHARALRPAQIHEFSPGREGSAREYFGWDRVPERSASDDEICAALAQELACAVRARLGSRSRAVSLLSGGLDSRAIVASLRALGAEVDTISFGPEGSADRVLAEQAASALGTRHFTLSTGPADFWPRQRMARDEWECRHGNEVPASVARALWTGEGGDRVLAPVNLTEDVASAMRRGDPEVAIRAYMNLENSGLPRRLFRRRVADRVTRLPVEGLRAELARVQHEDGARRFHLYVLLNESRRNIKAHFEDQDLSRTELVMPFYDCELVQATLGFPLDGFLRHRLYYRLLRFLPPAMSAVPWQAYPGSPPCPLPMPDGVRLQWQGFYTSEEEAAAADERRLLAAAVLNVPGFPGWLIRRPLLVLARGLMGLGMREYAYLFEKARPFVEHPPEQIDAIPVLSAEGSRSPEA